MNLPEMHWLTGAGIAAAAAAAGAFWSQFRNIARQISGLLFYVNTVSGATGVATSRYFRRNYRKLPSGVADVKTLLMTIKGYSISAAVPYAVPSGPSIWFGKHGIFLVTPSNGNGATLVSPRLFSRPFKLIGEASRDDLQRRNSVEDVGSNFYVRRITGSAGDMMRGGRFNNNAAPSKAPHTGSEDTLSSEDSSNFWGPDLMLDKSFEYAFDEFDIKANKEDAFKGLAYDEPVETLLGEINEWYKNREWYLDRNIPWRFGVQLVGPGGTGKSSLAKAMAQQLRIPLMQYYLNTMTDTEFIDEWEGMPTPCVVAFEDFDTVFHGREPATIHKSLSFECVLNQISGISALNGVLLVVTTNDITKIDPAMGQLDEHGRPTRPGRVDRILYMGATSEAQRFKMAQLVLRDWAEDIVEELVKRGDGMTAAQFQSLCIQAAFNRMNGRRELPEGSQEQEAISHGYQEHFASVSPPSDRSAVSIGIGLAGHTHQHTTGVFGSDTRASA